MRTVIDFLIYLLGRTVAFIVIGGTITCILSAGAESCHKTHQETYQEAMQACADTRLDPCAKCRTRRLPDGEWRSWIDESGCGQLSIPTLP